MLNLVKKHYAHMIQVKPIPCSVHGVRFFVCFFPSEIQNPSQAVAQLNETNNTKKSLNDNNTLKR